MTGISLTGVSSSSVAWGDYDNDGDLDILLTGNTGSTRISRIYRNNGNNTFTNAVSLTGVQYSSVAWGDYDNDGDMDILLTGYSSSGSHISRIYRNDVLTTNAVPDAPANLSVSVSEDDVTLSWDKSTDTETAQNALTYNLRIGTSSGGIQSVSPMANVSNGYRRVPALGNSNHNNSWVIKGLSGGTYYWSVQAVDNAFAGSAFATEGTFGVIGITTASITGITATAATGGGNVTHEGGSSVTAKGVVWDTSENPTVDSYTGKTNDGSGLGSFTSSLTGLTSGGQTYYVRAYATNSNTTAYGENKAFATTMTPPGNALDFDGTDDYVNVGNDTSFNVGNTLTIEAWVKPDNLSGRYGVFSTRFNDVSGAFQLEVGAGTNRVAVTSPGTYVAQTENNAITAGVWSHIAYTRSGTGSGTHTIYVNGVAQTLTSDDSYEFSNNTSDKVIGSGDSGGQLFPGQIDNLCVWNVARTETQIRDNMHKILNGDETGLVAYYKFDHLSDTALSDHTINDNDGTLMNMTDDDWVTSTAPLGEDGTLVQTQAQTNIGDEGKQMQVTITTGGDASNYLGIYRTGDGDSPISDETFPSGVTQRSDILWGVEEYGTVTADLVFDYSNVAGITNPSAIQLLKRTDAASDWTNVTSGYTHDTGNRTFSKTGEADFSEFSIGDGGDNSLPVELASFTATSDCGKVILNWVTQTETNNIGFSLYRSDTEDGEYSKVAWLEGAGNTPFGKDYEYIDSSSQSGRTYYYYLEDVDIHGVRTKSDIIKIQRNDKIDCKCRKVLWLDGKIAKDYSKDYRYLDKSVNPGIYYYYLKITANGVVSKSDIIKVEVKQIPKEYRLLPNFPNPFNPDTWLPYQLPDPVDVVIDIYNIKGHLVRQLNLGKREAGYYVTRDKAAHWNGKNY